ncbi:hypothetical protein [Lichenicoccus sp.]|uniref:hypothetical protein n=1 Tax=Lichenicoccus sp. TaxID=2781899 RepID=UPI003D098F3C
MLPASRFVIASAFVLLLGLAGCNGATPPEAAGQGNALPAMQPGPTTVGPAGLGPAGPSSALGSGNLANPGVP